MPAFVARTLLVAAGCLLLASRQASAAPPFVPPPPPAPPPAPPVEVTPVPPPPPTVAVVVTGTSSGGSGTDHDGIVGRWGIDARSLGEFQRSPGNDLSCGNDCPIRLNAISVRKWSTERYAWSAGLALGAGGGSRYETTKMAVQTWDTYFGVGPTVGAYFLLANWKHLAVSLSPQLDAVIFIPKGTGPKSFGVNLRGLVEGELHLGMIGVPQISVGTATGLVASLTTVSKSEMTTSGTASQWSIGFSGPQTLWGLVTNMYLRFYF